MALIVRSTFMPVALTLVLAPAGVHAAPATGTLPPPQRDPLHRIDLSQDTILQLEHQTDVEPRFRELVAAAVARTPAVAESIAARNSQHSLCQSDPQDHRRLRDHERMTGAGVP